MENVDGTAERLEMAAVKASNHTHAADDIDWFVSEIVCLCQWQFVNYFPMILNCLHSIVVCLIPHLAEPYSVSVGEIHSSICSVKNNVGKLL